MIENDQTIYGANLKARVNLNSEAETKSKYYKQPGASLEVSVGLESWTTVWGS